MCSRTFSWCRAHFGIKNKRRRGDHAGQHQGFTLTLYLQAESSALGGSPVLLMVQKQKNKVCVFSAVSQELRRKEQEAVEHRRAIQNQGELWNWAQCDRGTEVRRTQEQEHNRRWDLSTVEQKACGRWEGGMNWTTEWNTWRGSGTKRNTGPDMVIHS